MIGPDRLAAPASVRAIREATPTSPEDEPSDEQIDKLLNEFEKTAWARSAGRGF